VTPRVRRIVVTAAATASTLALVPAAWACNNPSAGPDGGTTANPGPGGSGVEPGGAVGFVISDIDEGASFTVKVEGQTVLDDIDDDGRAGYRGSFAMPELGGPSRPVSVDITVTHATSAEDHENGSWPSPGFTVQYRAPAPPVTPPAETPPAETAPAETPPEQPPTTLQQAPGTTGSTPGTAGGSPPAGASPVGPPPAGGPGSSGSPRAPVSPASRAESPARVMARVAATKQSATEGRATERTWSAREKRAAAGTRSAAEPVVAPERVRDWQSRPELPVAQPTVGDDDVPLSVPLAVALAMSLLLGVGGAGIAMARRRRNDDGGPPAEVAVQVQPDLVDAELQEMISEQRLRDKERTEEGDRAALVTIRDGPG
jgi:hypothetical protein